LVDVMVGGVVWCVGVCGVVWCGVVMIVARIMEGVDGGEKV
jgi:hypothetical protein